MTVASIVLLGLFVLLVCITAADKLGEPPAAGFCWWFGVLAAVLAGWAVLSYVGRLSGV